jgi:SNF2 family DNA or RNA helicase
MFQQTFSNALTEESPYAKQPSHITTSLRLHQLTSIEQMKRKEKEFRTGYTVTAAGAAAAVQVSDTIFSKYAILADRVGVGKTLMALAHISQMAREPLRPPPPMSNLHPASTSAFFSIQATPGNQGPTHHTFDSLVVVPHTLFRQWQDSIEQHTTLTFNSIKTQRDIDKESFITSISASHLTLISNTLLPQLMTAFKLRNIQATWRRVFYDEADSIKIPSTCPVPHATMTWFITASFANMLFVNEYYHSYIIRQLPDEYILTLHPELQLILRNHIASHPAVNFFRTQSYGFFKDFLQSAHPLRIYTIIRNSEEFLQTSIHLPPLVRQSIRCQSPISHHLVHQILPAETEAMLHAGDIQGALQSLGVPSHTPMTIVEAATAARQREIDRLQRLLAFKKEETYTTHAHKETVITSLERKITDFQDQIQLVRERIEAAAKDSCAICFEAPSEPCLTPCCSKLFCGMCILECMKRNQSCPLCRATFAVSELCSLGDVVSPSTKPVLPSKLDAITDILLRTPNAKFIIYSRYENTLVNLQEITESVSYKVAALQGNKDSIAKTLTQFANGDIQIVLLNSRNAAAGMNISSATHIILLHRMNPEEEKQVLGRAYRMDRTTPLTIIQLLHESE